MSKDKILEQYKNTPIDFITYVGGYVLFMDDAIKPVQQDVTMIGRAFTVNEYRVPHNLFTEVKEGQVIVFAGGGSTKEPLWGPGMSFSAAHEKVAGVVADGVVRGVAGLRKSELPVFTKGVTAKHLTVCKKGRVNVPVYCGNVMVDPGDIIIGNDDGVVVIPQRDEKTILEKIKLFGPIFKYAGDTGLPYHKIPHLDELWDEKDDAGSREYYGYAKWMKKYLPKEYLED